MALQTTNMLLSAIRMLAVLSIAVLLVCCKSQPKIPVGNPNTTQILTKADALKDSFGVLAYVAYIDSSLSGLDLAPAEKFEVFYRKHGVYLGYPNLLSEADNYADSMLWIIESNKKAFDSGKLFRACMSKANASYKLGQYATAFKYYARAKTIAYSYKSDCEEAVYLFRIAMSFYNEEKYLESARLFKETADKQQVCKNETAERDFRRQETIANIGLAYYKANMPDSSVQYYRAALQFIAVHSQKYPESKTHWEEALSVVYGNMGGAFMLLGSKDSAESYYLKSIALSEATNRNLKDRIFNVLKLAELYTEAGKYTQTQKLLEYEHQLYQNNKAALTNDSLDIVYRSTGANWKYYQKTGNYSAAIGYLQRHHAAQEAKAVRTHNNALNDLERGVDKIEHQTQIAGLEKDVQIKRQNNIIMALTVILSIATLVVIYQSLKRFKKNYKTLELKTEKITLESALKEEALQLKIKTDQLNFMALIENTDDFLWSVDKNLRYLAFNKAFKDYIFYLFGAYPETGQPDLLQKYNPSFFSKILAGYTIAFEGTAHQILDKGITVNGLSPDIEIRFKPIKDEHNQVIGVSCFRRDVTEFLGLIRKLALNNEQLKKIAWVQSHKLRGPLATIKGIAYIFTSGTIDDPQIALMMEALQEKIEEMDHIIHEIVAISDEPQDK